MLRSLRRLLVHVASQAQSAWLLAASVVEEGLNGWVERGALSYVMSGVNVFFFKEKIVLPTLTNNMRS